MITSKQAGAVTTIVHDYSGDDNVGLLYLTSDLHVDSVYCNRDALMSDLEEAKKRNALVFLLGDVFDAMQGRFDPRRSLDELRPEYRRNDYYDYVVKDVAKLLKPYAQNIMLITPGNHECLDEKAEVLTRSGWKPIADVTMDDEVLSIQNWDKVPLYAKPLAVHLCNMRFTDTGLIKASLLISIRILELCHLYTLLMFLVYNNREEK